MSKDLSDYYQKVGFYRANGLNEAHAHTKAEEVMMGPNEWNMQNILTDALEEYAKEAGTNFKIRTYEEAGLLTRDNGLVVEIEGSRFQLTIVKA